MFQSVPEEGDHLGRQFVIAVRRVHGYRIVFFTGGRFVAAYKKPAFNTIFRILQPGFAYGITLVFHRHAGANAYKDAAACLIVLFGRHVDLLCLG